MQLQSIIAKMYSCSIKHDDCSISRYSNVEVNVSSTWTCVTLWTQGQKHGTITTNKICLQHNS